MNTPKDYPQTADNPNQDEDSSISNMTYAALHDRVDAKKPVTDEMIRVARTKMDTAHAEEKSALSQGKFKLSNIRERFRAE